MTHLEKLGPAALCYKLDAACPPYYFTFSGSISGGIPITLYMYEGEDKNEQLAKFEVNVDNPLDYVVSKILLCFGNGTIPAW